MYRQPMLELAIYQLLDVRSDVNRKNCFPQNSHW